MIEIGKKQILTVINTTDFGIYLGEINKQEKVLLPIKQVPEGTKVGDMISVFVYRDSEDRLIATTREPMITLGEIAVLTVKEVAKIGAFLDWGLEKDLFLPFKEQTEKVLQGRSYPIALYVDKSKRLCGTMKISEFLLDHSPYQVNDQVEGIIYKIHKEIGAFVVVDKKYHALIPEKEFYGGFQVGDKIEARVSSIREDGRLNLSVRKKAYLQMEEDSDIILKKLKQYKGVFPFTDKTVDAQRLREEFHLSKNAFKRAIGRLLKENKIKITDTTIEQL